MTSSSSPANLENAPLRVSHSENSFRPVLQFGGQRWWKDKAGYVAIMILTYQSNYEISWIKAFYTLKTVASWIGSKDKLHKI